MVFWAFYAVLSRIRFVVMYALFRVKLIWLKPCSCKQVVFFNLWLMVANNSGLPVVCWSVSIKKKSCLYNWETNYENAKMGNPKIMREKKT